MSVNLKMEKILKVKSDLDKKLVNEGLTNDQQTMLNEINRRLNEAPVSYEGPERMEPGIERKITHGLSGTPSYISQTVMEFFRKLQPRIKMFIREHLIRSGSAFSLVLGRIVDGTMDILFGFIMTFIDFTARALISEAFWSSVKIVLTKVWEDFEEKGILAQTYNSSPVKS